MSVQAIQNRPCEIPQQARDPISGRLMTEAMMLLPCECIVNADTAKAMEVAKRCHLNHPIKKCAPFYWMRNVAKNITNPPDAVQQFLKGKKLLWDNKRQEAAQAFTAALEIHPASERAQVYRDFCLGNIDTLDDVEPIDIPNLC